MLFLYFFFTTLVIASTKTVDVFGPVQIEEPLPTFRGWSLQGESIGLTTFQTPKDDDLADIVIVSYFATWCLPCRTGIPIIEKLTQSKDITAIYISIDAAKDEIALQKFVKDVNISTGNVVIWDKFKKISERHGVVQVSTEASESQISIPKTFLIRPDGTVHTIFVEEGVDFEQQLQLHIQEIQKIQMGTSPK